jgi:hypothetical protein
VTKESHKDSSDRKRRVADNNSKLPVLKPEKKKLSTSASAPTLGSKDNKDKKKGGPVTTKGAGKSSPKKIKRQVNEEAVLFYLAS